MLPGNQIVLEGLISDVLSEHFGEAVELVGVTLLRHGPLSVADLVRVANKSLLSFPRDSVNAFNAFEASSIASIGWKQVRDSLLVLIHFGLVAYDASLCYTFLPKEALRRLCLPIYLGEEPSLVLQTVLRQGRVPRDALDTSLEVLPLFLKTVDSVSTSAGSDRQGLLVAANTDILHAQFLGSLMAKYVEDRLGDPICTEIVKRLMEGPLSVTDLESIASNSQQLVGALIRMQQLGWVSKQHQEQIPVATAPKRGRKSANKQAAEFDEFSSLVGLDKVSLPTYSVQKGRLLAEMQAEIVTNLVRARHGPEGGRVFAAALGKKLEAHHLSEKCAISREQGLKHLHALAVEGLCQIQEIPKVAGSLSAAGGVAAMMRAVSSSFWLYCVDPQQARTVALQWVATSIVNLRRRFRHEVFRQCRLEDRAASLSEAQEKYLQHVHQAQDVIETASIDLVHSLAVLLES